MNSPRQTADPTQGQFPGRKPFRPATAELVTFEAMNNPHRLPLVISPTVHSLSLAKWIQMNHGVIDTHLHSYGSVLFRGFDATTQEHFEAALDSLGLQRMEYMEGATPRKKLGGQVYTSTEFPPQYAIALHNELSYVSTWPMRVCFFCVTPSSKGGETPIADVRRVLHRIPNEIVESFEKKGWMLVRNFGDGMSLTWQNAFHTEERSEAEAYFRSANLDFEWRDEGRLRTSQVRPALAQHPVTGESVWFNHVAFWHASSLDPKTRAFLVKEFGEDGIPYNTFYGDGTPISDDVAQILRNSYEEETAMFPWQTGDLLITDNMLVAHGRSPFEGPRKIIVSMGNPYSR